MANTDNGEFCLDNDTADNFEDTEEQATEEQTTEDQTTAENESKEPEDDRKLFVRGLNYGTKADTLKAYCQKYGEVEQCDIKTHPNGQSRGFAFVVFKESSALTQILAEPKHELDSRVVEMKQATKREVITKVFVGGLSKEATDEQIRTYFEQFGTISEIDLPMDPNNQRRGFCFINYTDEEGLKKATEKRMHTVNGKECEVKKTQPKPRGGMQRGGGDWRPRGRGGYRGGFSGGYGGYGGYGGGYGGYDGYDYYSGGYGGGWGGYNQYGGGYGSYGGQQSNFGKQRGRGRGGYRPY